MPASRRDRSLRLRPSQPIEQIQARSSEGGSVPSCRFNAQVGQIQAAVDTMIAALRSIVPLTLFVRSNLPEAVLKARLGTIEEILPCDDDSGIVMSDVAKMDRAATVSRYRTCKPNC